MCVQVYKIHVFFSIFAKIAKITIFAKIEKYVDFVYLYTHYAEMKFTSRKTIERTLFCPFMRVDGEECRASRQKTIFFQAKH